MLLIHGRRKFFIRSFEPLFYKCPYCDSISTTEVFIYSEYYHVFWIPIFPIRKTTAAKCTGCDATRSEERFGPQLIGCTTEELKNSKHPIYSWAMLIFFGLLILLAVILSQKK